MSRSVDEDISRSETAHVNLTVPELVEKAISRGEGILADSGALVAYTGEHTGRSPKDRFIVAHGESKDRIEWGGFNQPIDPETFGRLTQRAVEHHEDRELFIVDGYVGADPAYQIRVRVIAEFAWHALFVRELFRRPTADELASFEPDFTLISASTLKADPERDGTNSGTFVGLDLERRKVVIIGTQYAGEMKKSIFSAANYLLPTQGVLTMHCSANVGANDDDVALFFGLSGTGKTTLSGTKAAR